MKAITAGVTFFALLSAWPVSTGSVRFLQITTPLAISAEKNHPPYIAFAETQRIRSRDEWESADLQPGEPLSTETLVISPPAIASSPVESADTIHLDMMRIPKPKPDHAEALPPEQIPMEGVESVSGVFETMPALQIAEGGTWRPSPAVTKSTPSETVKEETNSNAWIDLLPAKQRKRLLEAQQRSKILSEDWNSPGWRDEAEKAVQRAVAKVDRDEKANPSRVLVQGGSDPDGSPRTPVHGVASVAWDSSAGDDSTEISGEFQIGGGAAFLGQDYNHHFEVLRSHEGVDVEQGAVNVSDGTYTIRVRGRTGRVVARLRDDKGQIVGQDSFYLSQFGGARGRVKGPRLVLTPRTDIAGHAASVYPHNRLASLGVSALSGIAELNVTKQGDFELNQVQKGSMTILRAEAKDHAATVSLVPSGSRSDLTLFPLSWVASLKSIVSDQRRMSLDNPDSAVVWGRVTQDGKPRAGATVAVESVRDGLEAVYFNELMLPDSSLKATSSNGLFAFIGAPTGFQSLIARIGDAYLAHQNAVVEDGAVSIADLATTVRTEPSPIRVYDAFLGEPRPAAILHQGIEQEVEVDSTGFATVSLPVLGRMSLVMVRPEAPYAPATYLISDDQGYVHLPLVRDDWVRALQGFSKVNDVPGSSVVVGFVADEDFTAEVVDPQEFTRVIYFDPQGNPLQGNRQGVAGGGFVIYGLSEGVREVVVTGAHSKMISTRVVPSDPRAMTVLTFRSE